MKQFTATILLSPVFISCATSQILSCGDVGCPLNGDGSPDNCVLEADQAFGIGISALSTSLDQRPLTWTLAVKSDYEPGSLRIYQRDFYLGQPPTLDLEGTASSNGCALFFDGIASDLNFFLGERPGPRDNGTCEDALTSVCVADWRTQIQNEVNSALRNSSSLDCDALARTLQNNPPANCSTNHNSWGFVSAKPISGSDTPQPIQLTTCTPTLGSDYQMRPFASFNYSSQANKDYQFMEYLYGITPIVTVLAPIGGAPEIHLNCLKIVQDEPVSAVVVGSKSSKLDAPKLGLLMMMAAVLGLPPLNDWL